MVLALILAILFGTIISWFFVKPYYYKEFRQCSERIDND